MPAIDVRIKQVDYSTEDYRYRTPIKFGGVALDKVTLLNVTMTVETEAGKIATGFGSMPLGNAWAWPSKELKYEETLASMKKVASACCEMYAHYRTADHPIAIGSQLEHNIVGDPCSLTESLNLAGVIPRLAILVVNSAFDAALHDAYGKVHGLNCYHTYGPPFFDDDLGDYLGNEFRGEKLQSYISREPQPQMPLYHLVGALDPLTPAEVTSPVNDGLPETLGEWIRRDGLTHLKIKLNGDDIGWDVERVLGVNRVAEQIRAENWWYSLDFNERCQNVEYLLEFLRRLKDRSPAAFDRVQYIEQPTARDLKANPANKMHEAAKIKPVVIDESLLDLETLMLARDLGYTGVAFKACKGQTQSLLLAAAAQKFGMFRCVQDLTCPGASLIHSAGLAAHIPGVAAIEANSRQYVPAANEAWDARFPGIFTIKNGAMNTAILTGPGLGYASCSFRRCFRAFKVDEVAVGDSLVPSENKNLVERVAGRIRHFFAPVSPKGEMTLGDLRARTPSPVFWMFGKTQSGKSSVIHYLTGAEKAEIGSGFRPCTRTSFKYPFPEAEAPVLTFLDTRGLGEAGYDPAEDIAAFDKDAHLMLVTVRLRDFATGELREAIAAIRKANRSRPTVLVLTCLHEAYPQEQHPQPYPYETADTGPTEVLRLAALQRQDFHGLFDRVVLLDLTKPEEGFNDPEYGGPALQKALLELLPQAYRETLLRFENANDALKSQHLERAAPIIASYSVLAATAGAIPIPGIDLLVLPGIQTKMIHALATLSGNPKRGGHFIEFSAALGIGVIARHAVRQIAKFIPYVGSAVGASLAYSSTYALGRAYLEYDQEIHSGHAPDSAAIKRMYETELKTAEARWGDRK